MEALEEIIRLRKIKWLYENLSERIGRVIQIQKVETGRHVSGTLIGVGFSLESGGRVSYELAGNSLIQGYLGLNDQVSGWDKDGKREFIQAGLESRLSRRQDWNHSGGKYGDAPAHIWLFPISDTTAYSELEAFCVGPLAPRLTPSKSKGVLATAWPWGSSADVTLKSGSTVIRLQSAEGFIAYFIAQTSADLEAYRVMLNDESQSKR